MILCRREDRAVVVFLFWQSLPYGTRFLLSFALIAVGLGIQLTMLWFMAGFVVIAAGNLLLLVRGYDNRVDFGAFDPATEWTRINIGKLDELHELDRKIREWDVSAVDVTNNLGAALFVLFAAGLGAAAYLSRGLLQILVLDAIILFLPHWLTGIRSILIRPKIITKVSFIKELLEEARSELNDHRVDLMALLQGERAKIPEDLKFKIDINNRHEDFLGLYGQVVINEVQGSSYPYFYVVLLARRGYGLREVYERFRTPEKVTKEFKVQDEVELIVIRQRTTKKSGFHTKSQDASRIFREGLALAAAAAKGPATVP